MGERQATPVARLRLTRRARIAGRAFFGLSSALVLLAAALGWYLHASVLGGLSTSGALAGLTESRADGDLNILLMGLDSRRDLNGNDLPDSILDQLHAGSSSDVGGYNTNTLILLHVPADGSRAVALSIPRDDYVDLPDGLGKHKIKEAYGRAKAAAEDAAAAAGTTDSAQLEQIGREAGRRAAVEAVDSFLGVSVDHFVEINLAGFYDLANALGGVEVCLREPAHDWYSGADFPAGVQTLDGAQSLAFVRQRHGLANGDLDRTHRQQAFLASAVHKLQADGVFGDLGKVQGLLGVARKDVVVDSGFDLLSFLQHAGAVVSGNVEFYTLPIAGFATVDGESVNLVDVAQVQDTAARLLAGDGAGTGSGTGSGQPDGASSAPEPTASGPLIPQVATMSPESPESLATSPGVRVSAAAGHRSQHSSQHTRRGALALKPTTDPASSAALPVAGPASAASVQISAPPGVPCVD
jgi:LCP family protein required for cell wall assembly